MSKNTKLDTATLPVVSVATLAQQLGIKPRAVQRRANRLGLVPRTEFGGQFLFTQTEADAIRAAKSRRGPAPLPADQISRSGRSQRRRRAKAAENKIENS